MIYTIENKYLKVAADTAGAQLQSIVTKDNEREYLWQGDPAYWSGRAYNLFPVIGRMYKNIYTYGGKEYSVLCHGIARYRAFRLTDRSATRLVFSLTEDEDSLKAYPFRFRLSIAYELDGRRLKTVYTVENTDEKELIYALGGHPGFNVPFGRGTFEDYYLEFPEKANIHLLGVSANKFMSGESAPYPLADGRRLPLKHSLFDNDALIFSDVCRKVFIKSKADSACVEVEFPDFRFLGVWHTPETDAPFVCIEPWSALPATEGVVTELEHKEHMNRLAPGYTSSVSFSVEIHE